MDLARDIGIYITDTMKFVYVRASRLDREHFIRETDTTHFTIDVVLKEDGGLFVDAILVKHTDGPGKEGETALGENVTSHDQWKALVQAKLNPMLERAKACDMRAVQ